ncbi:MAG TPA: hypothetical protein VEW48_25225 [Thermoanaerobaculia bacterium]|nr:hypothetical protein [Thermoanaerobaculia bacterium]
MTEHRELPEPEVLERIVQGCRPELEVLFRRHWVSEEEAGELLDEVLVNLLLRWDRLEDPAAWLLRSLERAIPCRLLVPLFAEDESFSTASC